MSALPSGGALHREGPRGADAVLFLHGVGGGAWSWKPQRAALAGSYRLFTWEARGHGEAGRVADAGLSDYYVDAQEGLAEAVAEHGGPVFIVGHSMGGLLALALAVERTPSVRGLFLVDPVYATGEEAYAHFSPAVGRVARTLFTPILQSFERNGTISRRLARWLFERAFEDREKMEAAWLDQRAQIPVEYPRMLRESFDGPTGFKLRRFGDEIEVPVTLVDADKPGKTRFPDLAASLERRLGSRFTHEFIDGGHYLQLDRPNEITAALRRFLEANR